MSIGLVVVEKQMERFVQPGVSDLHKTAGGPGTRVP